MTDLDVKAHIQAWVQTGLAILEEPYRSWAETHLIDPRPIQAMLNHEAQGVDTFWLVTDHVGSEDAGYRIVFDPEEDMFGLITERSDGTNILIGLYGDFARTVIGM